MFICNTILVSFIILGNIIFTTGKQNNVDILVEKLEETYFEDYEKTVTVQDTYSEESDDYKKTVEEEYVKHNAVMSVHFYYFKSIIVVKENTAKIVMKKPSDEEVFASVYERYQAVWINLCYRVCSMYYTEASENTEISKTCNSYAEYTNWYNTEFSAKRYYELNPVKNEQYTNGDNNLHETVQKVDLLLRESIEINQIFESSSHDEVLQNLRKTSVHVEKKSTLKLSVADDNGNTEINEKNYHDETWCTLLEHFGPKLIEVENYFKSVTFQQTFKKITNVNELIPTIEESKMFWGSISSMKKEYGDNPENHDIRIALSISKMIIYWKKIKLDVYNIEAPKNVPQEFNLVKETSGTIDYAISLTYDGTSA